MWGRRRLRCQNQHQPSRGITTIRAPHPRRRAVLSQNQHQPSRGITTIPVSISNLRNSSQNQHQPSRGITTNVYSDGSGQSARQNQHQPSRGITTTSSKRIAPFFLARININPVEGLQRQALDTLVRSAWGPESTSTQSRDYNNVIPQDFNALPMPESTSTQSRDYNMRSTLTLKL